MDGKIGCVIIHGFAGSTEEIEPLNKYLKDKGYLTTCPELEGHTGVRKDLKKTTYEEWISSAEKCLVEFKNKCDKIFIIGFSMGGLIGINLALKYKISGLITLCSPIYYWDMKRVYLNVVEDFKQREYTNLKRYYNSSVRIPFKAMVNFRILLGKTKPLVKEIQCPIFVAQGLVDDTVHHRSAKYIYDNSSSKTKALRYYKNSNHIICCGDDQEKLFKDVEEFINKVSKKNVKETKL